MNHYSEDNQSYSNDAPVYDERVSSGMNSYWRASSNSNWADSHVDSDLEEGLMENENGEDSFLYEGEHQHEPSSVLLVRSGNFVTKKKAKLTKCGKFLVVLAAFAVTGGLLYLTWQWYNGPEEETSGLFIEEELNKEKFIEEELNKGPFVFVDEEKLNKEEEEAEQKQEEEKKEEEEKTENEKKSITDEKKTESTDNKCNTTEELNTAINSLKEKASESEFLSKDSKWFWESDSTVCNWKNSLLFASVYVLSNFFCATYYNCDRCCGATFLNALTCNLFSVCSNCCQGEIADSNESEKSEGEEKKTAKAEKSD